MPNPSDDNQPAVQKQVAWLAKHPAYLNHRLQLATPFLYYIYQQTQKRKQPALLTLIPLVESGYDPFGISTTGATGLWQMMPGTASGFGLRINWWYDGRRDIMHSTTAALDYLNYLHGFFGDWLLAIAAYDCGEGTVQNAVNRNLKHHRPTDFWHLKLPGETMAYVPRLLALGHIIHQPTPYHIHLPMVPNEPYFFIVHTKKQVALQQLANMAHIPLHTLRKLNPGFRRWATQADKSHDILIPTQAKTTFLPAWQAFTRNTPTARWQHYDVKKGDTLSQIAYHFHTNATAIIKLNHLKNNLIHVGQRMLIPLTPAAANITLHQPAVIGRLTGHLQQKNLAENYLPGPKQVIYTVKAHDSLQKISHRYHISAQHIRFWNKHLENQALKIGQTITLWLQPITRHNHPHFQRYCAKPGDNLMVLAHRSEMNVNDLKKINHLHSNLLRIGQCLQLPTLAFHHTQPPANAQNRYYRIKPGDTLSHIAHNNHLSITQLKQLNPVHASSKIKAGHWMRIG